MKRLVLALAFLSAAGLASAQTPDPAPTRAPAPADYALAYVSSDAMFVDMASIKSVDGLTTFKFLRVINKGQTIMEDAYAAALQEASVDCKSNEYRYLSITKLQADGKAGAKEDLRADIYTITIGTPEAALAGAACDKDLAFKQRAANVPDAIKLGHAAIAENKAPVSPAR